MAERRMFSKTIIDSDAFLDMPMSSQNSYFHLSMRADDEGFINNPKKIQRMLGASEDDLKLLIAKGFLITFDTGVVVIKHWRIHNYLQNDRVRVSGNAMVCGNAWVYGNMLITSCDDIALISNFGSKNRTTTFALDKEGKLVVKCGCFFGTIDEFRAKVNKTHKDSYLAKEYLMIADLMEFRFKNRKEKNNDKYVSLQDEWRG